MLLIVQKILQNISVEARQDLESLLLLFSNLSKFHDINHRHSSFPNLSKLSAKLSWILLDAVNDLSRMILIKGKIKVVCIATIISAQQEAMLDDVHRK